MGVEVIFGEFKWLWELCVFGEKDGGFIEGLNEWRSKYFSWNLLEDEWVLKDMVLPRESGWTKFDWTLKAIKSNSEKWLFY